MAALNVNREIAAIRRRTRRIAIASALLHLAAGWWLIHAGIPSAIVPEDEWEYTEITWLDPIPAPEPTPLETASASRPETSPPPAADPAPAATLRRERPAALTERLAALRAGSRTSATSLVTALETKIEQRAVVGTLANAPAMARELRRDSSGGSAALPAAPVERPIRRAAVDVAAVARPASSPPQAQPERREVHPGISLAGPVSGRSLVDYEAPEYPDWARRDGVEVTVELSFTVLPSGRVKENIRIERTSGYHDFDQRAQSSLRRWRFERLQGGATAEQWGRIEFNYRLKQAG